MGKNDCVDCHGAPEISPAQVHLALEPLEPRGLARLQSVDLSKPVGLAQCALSTSCNHPAPPANQTLCHMIVDSSLGNLIREPALRSSQTQYSCRGKTKEQIILDSSGSAPLSILGSSSPPHREPQPDTTNSLLCMNDLLVSPLSRTLRKFPALDDLSPNNFGLILGSTGRRSSMSGNWQQNNGRR